MMCNKYETSKLLILLPHSFPCGFNLLIKKFCFRLSIDIKWLGRKCIIKQCAYSLIISMTDRVVVISTIMSMAKRIDRLHFYLSL